MNGRPLLLAFLAFSLLILGLASLNGAVLALVLPLCVYLAVAIAFNPLSPRLSVDRWLSAEGIFPGNPVTVRLTVRNLGSALEELTLRDVLPGGLEVIEGETEIHRPLPAGGEIILEYTVRGGRGDYRFHHLLATARESFGLFESRLEVPAAHRLLIRPRPARLPALRIRPSQTRGFAGPIPSRQGGNGTDFFMVREYQPGDPLRRVNWKIAAHGSHELFTNVYEQERVADVGIILDAREQSYGDLPDHPLFERSVQAAASLAEGFLQDGNRVGLLVYGAGMESAFPGVGKVQRQRILHVLARAHTGRNYALDSLRYLPTRFFPPHSQVVLISPLLQADIEILVGLRAQDYSVLALSPNIVRFEAEQDHPDGRSRQALRLALAERALLLQKARRAGVLVIDWESDLPIQQVARSYAILSAAIQRAVEAS